MTARRDRQFGWPRQRLGMGRTQGSQVMLNWRKLSVAGQLGKLGLISGSEYEFSVLDEHLTRFDRDRV